MSDHLPREVREGLLALRQLKATSSRGLRVSSDGKDCRVIRLWDNGFALHEADGAQMRGLVDLYDGARHLGNCLVVADEVTGGERRFQFKRRLCQSDAPPVDFVSGATADPVFTSDF